MTKFLIPDAALTQHVIALGKTRSGKSSKVRLIVERFLDQKMPVCIIDPKGDWWGLKSSADGKRPGYPIIIFGSEHARHADIRINGHSGGGVAELIATGNRPCLIDLKGMRVGERTRFFIDFAAAYFTKARGARVLAIDEVHNFAPQGKVPDPQIGEMLHWINRLISEGGGMGITMLSASQRPQKVHKDYVTSHETLIATRVIHKLDRDAIKDWIDACGDPVLGKEVIGSLAGMQRTEAWVYSPEAGFGPVRLTFPMFKTYDSFKPQSDTRRGKLKGWASIDLKEVEAKLAHVVEEAKANDPKELRKRITSLEAQLRKPAPAAPAAPIIDKAAIATSEQAAFDQGYADAAQVAWKAFNSFKAVVTKIGEQMSGAVAASRMEFPAVRVFKPSRRSGQPAVKQSTVDTPKREPAAPVTREPSPVPAGGDGSLTPAKQKILDAIAWAASLGNPSVPKEMVGFLSGASPTSSGFQNNLGALRSAGLIEYPAGGMVALSAEGSALAMPPADAPTHQAIMGKIAARLARAQMRILAAAANAFPDDVSKEDLALMVEASPTSSGYQNNLGRLRTLGFITYPTAGRVRAGESLFP